MKKILVALDSLKYSSAAASYGIGIAKQTRSHLVGLMMDDLGNHSYELYELVHNEHGLTEKALERLSIDDTEKRKIAANRFALECRDARQPYNIHHDRNFTTEELVHESIFADLLIIDGSETFTCFAENAPTSFIRNLLSKIHCPVLIVREPYKPVRQLLYLYDGTPSSLHAIKMFGYLFPENATLPTEIIAVKKGKEDRHVPDQYLMKEFMQHHCPEAIYTILKGLPANEIVRQLKFRNTDTIIVTGSYGRPAVSRFFRSCMADTLMEEFRSAIFIAHS